MVAEIATNRKYVCAFCKKEIVDGTFVVEERLRCYADNDSQRATHEHPWGGINGIPETYEGAVVCYECHDEQLRESEGMYGPIDDDGDD